MRHVVLTATFILILGVWAESAQVDSIKNELKQLEGSWRLRKWETDGKVSFPEQTSLLIEAGTYTFVRNGQKVDTVKIVVDPAQNPKTFDMELPNGVKRLGIYRFNEDGELEICLAAQTSDKRPRQFTTKPDVGSGNMLFIANNGKGKVGPKTAAIQKELKILEGKWNLDRWEDNGRISVPEEGNGLLFDGDSYAFFRRGSKAAEYRVEIDPTKKPKTIDIYARDGQVMLGIYQFNDEGDLEICWNQSNRDKHPALFATKPGPGSGDVLIVGNKPDGPLTPKAKAVRAELKMLEGRWKMEKIERDGRSVPRLQGDSLVIVGRIFKCYTGTRAWMTAGIYIDPSKNPKTIDIATGQEVLLGIYRITEDGKLEMCWTQPASNERPSVFASKGPGSGNVMHVAAPAK